jgi:hypothetical protein
MLAWREIIKKFSGVVGVEGTGFNILRPERLPEATGEYRRPDYPGSLEPWFNDPENYRR